MPIPKIIHQMWKTNNVPKRWRISQQQYKKLHPDWTYMFWTDKSIKKYMRENHADYLKLWDNFPYHIQRVDVARYFILKDFGGVYSDLDIVPRRPLDPYFENIEVEALFVQSANFQYVQCFTNAFMVSIKGATIWDRIINGLGMHDKWWFLGKHLQVLNTTGPYFITKMIHQHDKILGYLPAVLFNNRSVIDIEDEPMSLRSLENDFSTVLVNIFGSSWHETDSKVYNFVFKNWLEIFYAFIILLIILFLKRHMRINFY